MQEITFKVIKCEVLLSKGNDEIMLTIEAPSTFPNIPHIKPMLTIDTCHDCGVQWCRDNLKMEPTVMSLRKIF